MTTCIRYFDDAVCDYFRSIKIEDGAEYRTPQIAFAIPSRQSFDIKLNNENSPIMPLLVVTRTGLSDVPESNIVKGHVSRPLVYSLTKNKKIYEGVELMYILYNYTLDIMALTDEMFNSLHQQILFRLKKHHYVPVKMTINNHEITHNSYIYNINFSDNTTYQQIPDTTNRLLHSSITFNVYGIITNDEYANKSVLHIKNTTLANSNGKINSYTETTDADI
jgi:hypothetical protein